MKTLVTTPALLATAVAILCSGCANYQDLRGVHTVSISRQIPKPEKLSYSDETSDNVASISFFTPLIAYGITVAPGRDLKNEARAGGISIESIMGDAMAKGIQDCHLFALAQRGSGDATFHLTIVDYGVKHVTNCNWSTRATAPFVSIKADLVRNDGKVVYSSKTITWLASETNWHNPENYAGNPAFLRDGWQDAATAAAQDVVRDIQDCLGIDNYGDR